MISCKILADSRNPAGVRLTSVVATYPRFVHSELLTHRAMSRNAASSRAIPIEKMIAAVKENPAWPEYWGSNKAGMQAGEPLEPERIGNYKDALTYLLDAALREVHWVSKVSNPGLHKQVANRYLEPWSHITTLITASEFGWSNFFALRAHPAAQPEFQVLAYRILDAFMKSEPKALPWGDWHIPEFKGAEVEDNPEYWKDNFNIQNRLKIATARCARISYLTFDGEHSPAKDIELHDRLIGPPFHASPFEHCARATAREDYAYSNFDNPRVVYGQRGYSTSGLSHWQQYRKQFTEENVVEIDPEAIMAKKPDWITL